MDSSQLEKYSSAITLSDMEIFVFPELMYSLVLANIMSPIIWKWRELDCFAKLNGKSSYKKLMRLKQFIIDEFEFNLDLETWGLTEKDTEIKRFEKFIRPEEIEKSNALFGYTGDKYYFDVDIRRHFGLDDYNNNIIPYWKTETIEAMNAFRLKPGYSKAAGECVSLASLYAAAAFIVCEIPLEDIYMLLTPLHSQNYLDLQDGVLTNNRRLVTKTMWFNGTAISNKAQRALRNEKVTIVAHSSGYVHCLYKDATIDRNRYQHFCEKLGEFLSAELNMTLVANFLRFRQQYQKFFQICRDCHGQPQFIKAEQLFHYEHGSKFRIADSTFDKLLAEVSEEDFVPYQIPGRIRCDELSRFLDKTKCDLRQEKDRALLTKNLAACIPDAEIFVAELTDFIHTEPRLPALEKNYHLVEPIKISTSQSREEIINYLQQLRSTNTTADLAFYAYRDMQSCDWLPFVKAAIHRNPVSLQITKEMNIEQVYNWLQQLPKESIYDAQRLAQPDEVANYGTGDGLEKAFLLVNVIAKKQRAGEITITINNDSVTIQSDKQYQFASIKKLKKQVVLSANDDINIS